MEQVKPASKVLKFAPVKLVIVDNHREYCRIFVWSIVIGLSHVLIGATVMVIIMYTLHSNDLHVILCTLGYHFFSAEAILSLSVVNGWSANLLSRHRRCIHVVLQGCSFGCVVIGIGTLLGPKGLTEGAHSVTGFLAAMLSLLCIITGPLGLHQYEHIKMLHMTVGLITFAMSTLCLCLGFFVNQFTSWAGFTVVYILTAAVILYTLCIIIVTIMKHVWYLK